MQQKIIQTNNNLLLKRMKLNNIIKGKIAKLNLVMHISNIFSISLVAFDFVIGQNESKYWLSNTLY